MQRVTKVSPLAELYGIDVTPVYEVWFWIPFDFHEEIAFPDLEVHSKLVVRYNLYDVENLYDLIKWIDEHANGRKYAVFMRDFIANDQSVNNWLIYGNKPTDVVISGGKVYLENDTQEGLEP